MDPGSGRSVGFKAVLATYEVVVDACQMCTATLVGTRSSILGSHGWVCPSSRTSGPLIKNRAGTSPGNSVVRRASTNRRPLYPMTVSGLVVTILSGSLGDQMGCRPRKDRPSV